MMMNIYWDVTYYPRCLILLARYRQLVAPRGGRATLGRTLLGIAKMQIRPHWLRA